MSECLFVYRENQIRIEFTMQPIEESYAALNKYNLIFNDGNAERVDSLSYGWKKVTTQVSTTIAYTYVDIDVRVCVYYFMSYREKWCPYVTAQVLEHRSPFIAMFISISIFKSGVDLMCTHALLM